MKHSTLCNEYIPLRETEIKKFANQVPLKTKFPFNIQVTRDSKVTILVKIHQNTNITFFLLRKLEFHGCFKTLDDRNCICKSVYNETFSFFKVGNQII